MSDIFSLPYDVRSIWSRVKDEERIHPLDIWGWNLVRRIANDNTISIDFFDLVLAKCSVRPLVLAEQGLTIAMIASLSAREKFRARLVACGMYLEAMRLAEMMKRRLSRDEVVVLGNNHLKNLDLFEAEKFVAYASVTEGMELLDTLRIQKQFRIEVVHINL